MLKVAGWTTLGIVLIAAGFLYHYESLDPCEWMTQEIASYAGISGVKGLGDPAGALMDKQACLSKWMDLRVAEAEK